MESNKRKTALRAAIAATLALAINAGFAWGFAQITTKGERRAIQEARAAQPAAVAGTAVAADHARS